MRIVFLPILLLAGCPMERGTPEEVDPPAAPGDDAVPDGDGPGTPETPEPMPATPPPSGTRSPWIINSTDPNVRNPGDTDAPPLPPIPPAGPTRTTPTDAPVPNSPSPDAPAPRDDAGATPSERG